MKTHTIRLHPAPYAAVSSGRKTIESRLFDAKRQQIALGDQLVFVSRQDPADTTTVRVIGLWCYATFADLFAHHDPEQFGGVDARSLLAEIRQFYSEADETELGVVGIEFEQVS